MVYSFLGYTVIRTIQNGCLFYSQGKVVSGMLTKFELKNYKNFKEKITLDLTKVGGYQFSTDCVKNNVLNKERA